MGTFGWLQRGPASRAYDCAPGVPREALEEASGRKVGNELGLCYSPGFIALGSVLCDLLCPDMVLIGECDSKAGDMLESIYRRTAEGDPEFQRTGSTRNFARSP
jgi:UDP-glucose 6-dehydrogenase